MAILDAFKKKDKEPAGGGASPGKGGEKEPVKEAGVKIEKKEEKKAAKVEKSAKSEVAKPSRGGSALGGKEFSQVAAKVLKSPHVTEKAMNLGAQNKYIFKVNSDANKIEVKSAIQELYGVAVQDVNMINIPRRKMRLGAREGFKPGFKKAVVTLKEGEKIDTGV